MYQHTGRCVCGAVNIEFTAPNDLNNYSSRQCDCDYCLTRGIEYLSDPLGEIVIYSNAPLQKEQQGSKQATFLLCSTCQSAVAVGYLRDDVSVGSVNATLLDNFENCKKTSAFPPKTLDSQAKVQRWRKLWAQLKIVMP